MNEALYINANQKKRRGKATRGNIDEIPRKGPHVPNHTDTHQTAD